MQRFLVLQKRTIPTSGFGKLLLAFYIVFYGILQLHIYLRDMRVESIFSSNSWVYFAKVKIQQFGFAGFLLHINFIQSAHLPATVI